MQGNLNPRTVGACLIGFALVAGAYVASNFGIEPIEPQTANVISIDSTPRVAIAVEDTDQNGIEDWRDAFVDNEEIVIDTTATSVTDYEPPTTLTGQLGVNFIESYLRSKTYGAFGRSEEELIQDTVEVLASETAHDLYDTPDITILETWTDADILTYANTIALAITNNDIPESENELSILMEVLESGSADRVGELEALATVYQNMRDATLATPVPAFLAKEHLDLINTYHAVHKDIEAMAISLDDPAFGLMRLKRYEDDVDGLEIALENMYTALLPYASLVGPDDPALLFVVFSDDFTS